MIFVSFFVQSFVQICVQIFVQVFVQIFVQISVVVVIFGQGCAQLSLVLQQARYTREKQLGLKSSQYSKRFSEAG